MTDSPVTHQHVRLTFPPGPATEPVIYQIVTRFDVVPNIRRASIQDHTGWMVLDLAGDPAAVDAAVAYLESIGVDVSRAEGDVVEG
ncbi:MAG: NIL domain-containing protein [Actinobacteria bacterium]|jgi:ABC-type methionine transport system ATPase subunit|nr:NIL domain-containing protein [Actinomycetota bacterium]